MAEELQCSGMLHDQAHSLRYDTNYEKRPQWWCQRETMGVYALIAEVTSMSSKLDMYSHYDSKNGI